jgi:hypothetical protein
MMKTWFNILAVAACVVILIVPVAGAQQQSTDQSQQQTPADKGTTQSSVPIPAYRSPLASAADNGDDTDTELTPDSHSLTGVQPFSLGAPITHSYWQPHFDTFSTADSNPLENSKSSGWGNWTSFTGGVDIHRASANTDLELSYIGGGTISSNSTASNGVIQGLDFSDKFLFRRWAIAFLDDLNYLPESSSGYGGLGAGTLPGSGSSGPGSIFGTGQSLLTGRGQNLGNSFETEVDAFLTRRSSLTFVGGYSVLDYFDSDLLNYGTANFRAGYNYQLDRKNTIGLSYTFSDFNYTNFHQSIVEHTMQASYGRRITGRLAFQIAAGPQVASFDTPISTGSGSPASEGTTTTAAGPTTKVYWSLNTNLQYAQKRTAMALSYNHGVGGGSGVLAGSVADTVSGSVTRQMSRTFSSGVSGGYSRNQGLAIGTTTPSNQNYDYWYGGANLSYPFGRSLGLTLSYQLQYQTSNAAFAFCTGPACGQSAIRHTISVGVGWHERPLLF